LPLLAAILPLLPPITRNVKLYLPAKRLEFRAQAHAAPHPKSKSGKNGNVDHRSQHCQPTTLSSTDVGRFRGGTPSGAVATAGWPSPSAFVLIVPSSLRPPRPPRPPRPLRFNPLLCVATVFLRVLCGSSRLLRPPPRPGSVPPRVTVNDILVPLPLHFPSAGGLLDV